MPDYSKGKIYTIRCKTDDTLIYVGSTIQSLAVRFGGHKRRSKLENQYNPAFYRIVVDWNDWYIELYENSPCNSLEELRKREGEVIRDIGTLNKNIPGRSKAEYRQENIDEIKESEKEYRQNHPDIIKATKQRYRDMNIEKIKESEKQYRLEHADIIKLKKQAVDQVKINCDCGGHFSQNHKARHEKTKIHLNFLKLKQ